MIVGVDIGTQSLKAVVTDPDLRVLGEAAHGYAPAYLGPGRVEQRPALWEEGLYRAVAAALAEAGVRAREVRALGVAGQLDGCVAVDDKGPVGPCLIWMDRRASAQTADVAPELVRERSGLVLDASHMAAKIRWLKEHCPETRAAVCFHQAPSYLVFRLTGRHVYDHGLASTTMLYSLHRRGYDPVLLDAFGLDSGQLPEIEEAFALAGELTAQGSRISGLPEGIPVAVGTGDDYSTPLGAGMVEPGRFVCVLGTAEVTGALDFEPKIDPGGLVETHSYFGRRYFIENPGWLSGGALEWFVRAFRLESAAAMGERATSAEPGCGGLTFFPALTGAMAPEWEEAATGCFFGLTPSHGSEEMARAVFEGLSFAMRDVLERLRAMQVPVESILLLGGGARSSLWAQMRADVCGLPVEVPPRLDTSPVGGAILAAVAAGIQPDLETCAPLAAGAGRTIAPNPDVKPRYDEAYERYGKLFSALKPLF
jgi:xylulokinase